MRNVIASVFGSYCADLAQFFNKKKLRFVYFWQILAFYVIKKFKAKNWVRLVNDFVIELLFEEL
jgi:hypothetical protein